MLLLGVLGLAFAGGETKTKKSAVVVQAKKNRRVRRRVKSTSKSGGSSRTQRTPSSNGNHMSNQYNGHSQSTTHDVSTTIDKRTPQQEVIIPSSHRRQGGSGLSTTKRERKVSDSLTSRDRPRSTNTTYTNTRRTSSTSTSRESRPTSSSTTRRERERRTTTSTPPRSSDSSTRREKRRRSSSTNQTTTRKDRVVTTTTQRTTSSTPTRRRRSYERDNTQPSYSSSGTEIQRERQDFQPRTSNTRRERTQQSESSYCTSSSYRVGLRGSEHALEMNSDTSDTSMGWAVGFQPCDGIFEIELSHVSFGDDFSVGVDSPVNLTAQLYGSDSGLAPFVSFGIHGAYNDVVKELGFMDEEILIGMHGGLGVRYKAGPISVSLEGRYGSYVDEEFSQLQGIAGVNLHF